MKDNHQQEMLDQSKRPNGLVPSSPYKLMHYEIHLHIWTTIMGLGFITTYTFMLDYKETYNRWSV